MAGYEIKNEHLTVGISTMGAELQYVRGRDGIEYLWDGSPNVWHRRSPLLFPICGGIKDDSYTHRGKEYRLTKHGFAQDSEFVLKEKTSTSAVFLLTDSAETLAIYPFSFYLSVVYELKGNALSVRYLVENKSNEPMWFSIGAHEGYSCPEGIEAYDVVFDEPVSLNAHPLDGNTVLDRTVCVLEEGTVFPLRYEYFAVDALVFKNVSFRAASLVHRESGRTVRVSFPDAEYFLLWTKPNAKYICLEPWLGIPDGENAPTELKEKEGIRAVPPLGKFATEHTLTFTKA